jgi:tetratricopeptide (TPR) repeat protein
MASKRKGSSTDSLMNRIMLWLADKLEQMGKVDNALSIYNSLLKSNPRFMQALSRRCFIYVLNGQTDKATADAQKAVSACPRDAIALRTHGILTLLAGNYDDAQKDFKKALELNEWDAHTCLFAYLMCIKLGDQTETVDFLREAVDNKIKVQEWPYELLQFWRGSKSITDLMAQVSTDNARLLECRTYMGFSKAMTKYPKEGKSDLQFVHNARAGIALVKVMAARGLKVILESDADEIAAKREKADKTAGMDWLD